MKKILFFVIWLVLLAAVPITIFRTTSWATATVYPVTAMNFLQRFTGLTLFVLLFVQIILGAFMDKWVEKIGGWVFNFHVFEGRLIYFLAAMHPILFVLFNHFAGSGYDVYKAFVNICLLCKYPIDYYYTLGRISFWLLTVAVMAAVFRKTTPWLVKNWRKMHVLNYVVFLLIGAHGFLLGTDFKVSPFYYFAILAYAIIAGIVAFINLPRLYKNFKVWVNS
jgi:predicted ferric reductase